MSGDYEVGYKKPPKATQFKKGQSGNRRGRPKGTKNLKADLLEEMQEQIRVREGNREKKISKQRGIVKNLAAQAFKGNVRAANTLLGYVYRLTHADATTEPAVDLSGDDLAIIEGFTKRRTAKPTSSPDPDHNSGVSNGQPVADVHPNNLSHE